MSIILPLYGAIFLGVFAAALLMPRLSWLLVYALVAGAGLGWAIHTYGVQAMSPATVMNWVTFARITILWMAVAGLVAGVLTRLVTLAMREAGKPFWHRALAILGGLALVPAVMVAVEWTIQREATPPEDCAARDFPFELAGKVYSVPAAPVFRIITARSGAEGQVDMARDSHLAFLCRRKGQAPFPATALILRFEPMLQAADARVARFCATTGRPWGRELCVPGAGPVALDYPVKAALYALDTYDHRRLQDSDRGSFALLTDLLAEARAAGTPYEGTPEGAFTHFDNGYWLARESVIETPEGTPYTMACTRIVTEEAMFCTASYGMGGGAGLTYSFRAPIDDVASTAVAVDATLRELLEELATPR